VSIIISSLTLSSLQPKNLVSIIPVSGSGDGTDSTPWAFVISNFATSYLRSPTTVNNVHMESLRACQATQLLLLPPTTTTTSLRRPTLKLELVRVRPTPPTRIRSAIGRCRPAHVHVALLAAIIPDRVGPECRCCCVCGGCVAGQRLLACHRGCWGRRIQMGITMKGRGGNEEKECVRERNRQQQMKKDKANEN
jgi:hypothetical protein